MTLEEAMDEGQLVGLAEARQTLKAHGNKATVLGRYLYGQIADDPPQKICEVSEDNMVSSRAVLVYLGY